MKGTLTILDCNYIIAYACDCMCCVRLLHGLSTFFKHDNNDVFVLFRMLIIQLALLCYELLSLPLPIVLLLVFLCRPKAKCMDIVEMHNNTKHLCFFCHFGNC